MNNVVEKELIFFNYKVSNYEDILEVLGNKAIEVNCKNQITLKV